ncbi:MAG TPA: ABC transporter permease, partial [Blastocatellia bacterium]
MDTFLKDLRFALRMLAKKPGFTALTILVLALGMGVNTAIFSVVSAVLLNPPPYKDPDRIVMVWGKNPRWQLSQDVLPASNADFKDWRDQNTVFENMAALLPDSVNLTGSGEPERVGAVSASTDFFRSLGVEAARGRTFLPDDDESSVVLLSHGLWKRRFNADPDIINSQSALNGKSYTVIGILPSKFEFPHRPDMLSQIGFPRRIDLWMPLEIDASESRGNRTLAVVARMKPNITLDQAQSEMNAIAARLEQQYPNWNTGMTISISPLQEETVGKIRPALLVLFGAVGFVLLIACANVANLLLSRATDREKEIAIRLALGAGRGRIIRQLLTESLLISIAGAGAGLLFALWGTDFILAFSPGSIPRASEITIDSSVLLFTLFLSVATGIVFGLAPALQASKTDLNETLKEGGRGATGGRNRTRSILVISEIALTLVLAVGAGLLIKS